MLNLHGDGGSPWLPSDSSKGHRPPPTKWGLRSSDMTDFRNMPAKQTRLFLKPLYKELFRSRICLMFGRQGAAVLGVKGLFLPGLPPRRALRAGFSASPLTVTMTARAPPM